MHHIDIATITLAKGAHDKPRKGKDPTDWCVMEATAYFAGEPWSDHPACTSRAIGAFLRSWNDTLPDADRTRLLAPLIPEIVGTATGEADEEARAWLATDWLVRTFAPAWLRLAGMEEHAKALEGLDALTSDALATAALPIIAAAESAAWSATRSAARSAAESAGSAVSAWSATWSAAWSAAESAARSATRSAAEAAWSAAWSAAESAAWSATWSAAESATWSAARSATRSAARSAAESAAESAARSAAESATWSAARSAVESALAPTIATLQDSAVDLVRRMAAVGREVAA